MRPAKTRPLWIDCKAAAELALMIDALPQDMREPILAAVLRFERDLDFERAYLVGVYRSLLFGSVQQFAGSTITAATLDSLSQEELLKRIEAFTEASDLAQVQLGVCDLLELFCDEQGLCSR